MKSSKEVSKKLAQFLSTVAEIEKKVEVTRQVLVEHRDFDPISTFKRILVSGDSLILSQIPGSITSRNVTSFRQDEDQNFLKQNVLRAEHFNRFLIEVRKKNSVPDAQVR